MTRFVEGLLPKQVRSRYALKLLAVSLLITVVIIHRELNRASDEPLATTQIDWGETVTGEEVTFQFDSTADTLVSWVYLDHGNMSVAIASPTQDGDHVLIGEYHPSTRVAAAADATEGTSTVVLGGVSGYVMFEKNSPNEFRPYKGESTVTEVESRIEDRQNQFAPLSGAELDDTEMRGYHSVPSDGVNWVVIKEVPRSTALVVTDQIQNDLAGLIGLTAVGFLLIIGMTHFGPSNSIRRLSARAEALARGDLTVTVSEGDRIDEVGQLRTSLLKTKRYLGTITEQAEKIAQREFDDEALDEEVPGPVGEAMVHMRDDLERFIKEREQREQRLEVFHRLLRHNLRNRLDIIRSYAERQSTSRQWFSTCFRRPTLTRSQSVLTSHRRRCFEPMPRYYGRHWSAR